VESAGVRVQGLGENDQVLALAHLAESRSDAGVFTPKAIDLLFHELRLPAPTKTSNNLASLEKSGLVRRGTGHGLWRVTPKGKATSESVVSGMDLAALQAEAATAGARLGGAAHPVILPEFGAPPELVPSLRDFLAAHEFTRNVFGMTRFPNEGSDAPPDSDLVRVARHRDFCGTRLPPARLSCVSLADGSRVRPSILIWASGRRAARQDARLDLREHRQLAEALQVARDPLGRGRSVVAEGVHAALIPS
jgi:hypothetical protein